MAIWKKKEVAKEIVKEISSTYKCDLISASILARRGVTEGGDILYYLENDRRFLHNPFLFEQMEDAVDRILDAVDEKEKVFIFGDRDVDGVTSTVLLYEYLKSIGCDVSFKVPTNDESYGLTNDIIDEAATNGVTLIITVDCGISNKAEIAYAAEKCISVIVTDHHNPPNEIPEDAIIINPKLDGSTYPFKDISGCAVSYKLVEALRFARCKMYKQEICLMNVRPVNEAYAVECIKVINMTEVARITEIINPKIVDVSKTRLISFLNALQIYVWDKPLQQKMLNEIFGKSLEFNCMDIRTEVEKVIPSVANFSLLRLKDFSKIAKYNEKLRTEIDAFFNIFVTYVQSLVYKNSSEQIDFDLQLVALAAVADIMPLQNENRIFVKQGLSSINSGKMRCGLKELVSALNFGGKEITSKDLGWTIVPCLNATGRMGESETAIKLFTTKNATERQKIAERIIELNQKRKQLGQEAWNYVSSSSKNAVDEYNGNLCVIYDKRISRGVTGIVATKLASTYKVPSVVITEVAESAIGSSRSSRGYNILNLMDQCAHLFIKYGGHDNASGFSIEKANVKPFMERLQKLSSAIEFSEDASEDDAIEIAAELPAKYVTSDILKLQNLFEPYGNGNAELHFLTKNVKIANVECVGKNNAQHLKLTLDIANTKWPALYWNAAEKYKTEFSIGDFVDVVFEMSKNFFNGMETYQLIIKDLAKTGTHEIV